MRPRPRGQPTPERRAGAVEMRLHRPERQAERIGDLLVGKLLNVPERQRSAIGRGELGHRGHDFGDLLAAHRGQLRSGLRRLGILRKLVDRHLMRVPALRVVEARVRGDAEDPGPEGIRRVVLMERSVRADERLLGAVVRRISVMRDPQRDVVHAPSVSLDQHGVRIGVTQEAELHDLLIGPCQPSPPPTDGIVTGHFQVPGRSPPCFRRIVHVSMDLTWLGHACFRARGREGIVLTDPPDPKSGRAIPKTAADLVTISHDDPKHASLRSVGGEPIVLRGPGEYEVQEILVTGIGTFRDEESGRLRGRNTVYAIRLDDLVICHLGGLGHALPAADLERLGDVDVVLVPIGGGDVDLTAARAAEVIHQLEPKVVVPMSYDPDAQKKDSPFERLLHELGVKDLTPVTKLSVTRSSLPDNIQVVALDSRARS